MENQKVKQLHFEKTMPSIKIIFKLGQLFSYRKVSISYFRYWVLMVLWLGSEPTIGQIKIHFPQTRAVFQRKYTGNIQPDTNRTALSVAGNFTQNIDRVEARLVPILSGGSVQGAIVAPQDAIDTGWQLLQASPSGGYFQGSISGRGGWYNLLVRGLFNNIQVGVDTVRRVGIGEVFVIVGQSNANGGATGPMAGYEQVSAVEFSYDFANFHWNNYAFADTKITCPTFKHLDSTVAIAPFGNAAWIWGAVGDSLVKKWRVPVAFFQAGWAGTGSNNWAESTDTTYQSLAAWGFYYPKGQPYGNLRLCLQHYAHQFGIRAVLMHQGENDAGYTGSEPMIQNNYYLNWKHVIATSRLHSDKPNLAWVVSRVSRLGNTTRPSVIAAQDSLIALIPKVFPGPKTDSLGPSFRTDGIHFSPNGMRVVATQWANYLNTFFLNNATPYQPATLLPITTSCNGSQLTLSAQAGWHSYRWFDPTANCTASLSTAQASVFSGGMYQAKIRAMNAGNYITTSRFLVPGSVSVVGATATVSPLPVVAGNTVTLTASGGRSYSWIGPNGFGAIVQSPSLVASGSSAGNYTVQVSNLHGCMAPASVSFGVITAIISIATGNWNQNNTWDCNCQPTSQTPVTIRATDTVTVPAGVFPVKSIVLNGILHFATGSSLMLYP